MEDTLFPPNYYIPRLLAMALLLGQAACVQSAPRVAGAQVVAAAGAAKTTFQFGATMESGVRVAFTINHYNGAKGSVREVRWKKGKDPARDQAYFDMTTSLYDLQATRDGSKIICKAEIPMQTPIVTFLVRWSPAERRNKQAPPKEAPPPPVVVESVTGTLLGLGDQTNVYQISERDRKALIEFVVRADFPELRE